ncbi:TM0106 family RecB-like putative nuclease [Corynebacterium sp. sy017]|uniref:TM0106 family RecB-like putative nuclease n=1 Tax=unclassified Corynebacterium TaxID=2624378 RepID=UPI0011852307|nr:TM0106 family RecB-like putative nuclease [Corynebacterium sp. SY003]MBP3089466.1 TM0106 family RecB-like putative nuclease [Corynebacterium sp. sy017]TSD90853.1 TM0106 family RecB-like putative nuclease [Corynebacterium sp. SY003]
MCTDDFLTPDNLVGCRYRLVQKQRYPHIAATTAAIQRKQRHASAAQSVFDLLPLKPQLGDNRHFLRIDLDKEKSAQLRFFDTLEAIAAGAHIITHAVLETLEPQVNSAYQQKMRVEVAALVRRKDGSYYPVVISHHRVARPDPTSKVKVVATKRLGLGNSAWAHYRLKNHAIDSFRLAMADRALTDMGLSCHRGGLIGQDSTLVFLLNTDFFQQGLDRALAIPTPTRPHRVRECAGCRFWHQCEAELIAADDLSLFLSGDLARKYQKRGINTVEELIRADQGEDSVLAYAWRTGIEVLKRDTLTDRNSIAQFDVEIDIDVEAYLDQGAYLWGTYDGNHYRCFSLWEQVGTEAEGHNFAQFWQWLCTQRAEAQAAGKSFGVFCYSAHGENHWLKFSAKRFYGVVPGVPHPQEIQEFISSSQWIDVFAYVKKYLAGSHGLGLKQVAPIAGFQWREQGVDGEESMNLYRQAIGMDIGMDSTVAPQQAKEMLLSYNGDDCKATRAVRHWLAQGAPGVPLLSQVEQVVAQL